MTTNKVDILVLGATGYTGKLVTEYLENHPSRNSFSLGIGGRSLPKLQTLAKEQSLSSDVATFAFNISNSDEVNDIVKRAKVVINCIGPFWMYSTPIVGACAANGVHYLDVSGEPWWIKDIIHEYDYLAAKNKTLIIPAAGLDSVPRYLNTSTLAVSTHPSNDSDLAVYLSARALVKKHGANISLGSSITAIKMFGLLSGGTFTTMLSAFDMPGGGAKALSSDLYSLSSIKGIQHPPRLSQTLPFSSIHGGISLMGAINERIVNRTWGLLEARAKTTSQFYPAEEEEEHAFRYGPNFCYEEYSQWPFRFMGSLFSLILMGTVAVIALVPPVRWFLKLIGPKAGTGPKIRSGESFTYTNITSSDGPTPKHVKTTVTFQGSGYTAAGYICSEAALAILLDHKKLPSMSREGGVQTTMTALGDVMVKRLLNSGHVTYESHILHPRDTRKTV